MLQCLWWLVMLIDEIKSSPRALSESSGVCVWSSGSTGTDAEDDGTSGENVSVLTRPT